MKSWLLAAFVGAALIVVRPAALEEAVAAPSAKATGANVSAATDFSAHRHHRRYHRHTVHSRPYPAVYNARPITYRPYPYQTPVPFFLGIGFGPGRW